MNPDAKHSGLKKPDVSSDTTSRAGSADVKDSTTDAAGELKRRLAQLDPEKRALLLRNLNQRKNGVGRPGSIISPGKPLRVQAQPTDWDCKRTVTIYPAAPGQLQMWFLQQYASESPLYNAPMAFHLVGPLEIGRLESAFNSVIERHAPLRATFAMEEAGLVQQVASSWKFELEIINLESGSADQRMAEADRWIQQLARRPFNLSRDMPIRAGLVRFDSDTRLLVIVLHHIISDGWSRSILCRELSVFYRQSNGRNAGLPSLPIQFSDYGIWSSKRQRDGSLQQQTVYWKNRLRGQLDPLNFPTDRPPPAVATFRGDRCSVAFDSALLDALKRRAQAEGVTLFTILLAAFKVLLYRYTGTNDLRVGVAVADRPRVETQRLIGFFINTLVIRTKLRDKLTFRELLGLVKVTTVESYENAALPFEAVLDALKDSSGADQASLVETMFALQDFPETILSLPGVQVEPWPVTTATSKVDLNLIVERHRGGWQATIEYRTDLFDAERMKRALGQWIVILESVARDPAQLICEIPLLTPLERHQVLVEWNQTQRNYSLDGCVHHLFEQQAARIPESVAVVSGDFSLTYRQLNERANRLADLLRGFNAGPDRLVGLYIDRSPEMVVALLAILKSGSGYLPLDLANPAERAALILNDARPCALLVSRKTAAGLAPHDIPTIRLDELPDTTPHQFSDNVRGQVASRNLAYSIYTSGSTGPPRGVLIEHRSLVNYILAAIEKYSMRQGDRVLQFASLSFDTSAEEIFSCLCAGATLFLRTDEMIESPAAFLRQCAAWKITVTHLPTAYWSHLAAQADPADARVPASLRLVAIGGERASRQALRLWQKKFGRNIELFNTYGPTETTITGTWCDLTDDVDETQSNREVPIGRPVPNATAYVLDGHLQPVPIGVTGELFIGGIALARGYLNEPELTAERFIPNPFCESSDRRMYRTGDKARYRSDGVLEFHGRVDHQVKIRGHRIELGEIESALAANPDVGAAAVISRRDDGNEQELAAYVAARNSKVLSVASLRDWLRTKLPAYMVPGRFTLLPALPITVNGKVDRAALTHFYASDAHTETVYLAPRDELERNLVAIWESVLNRPNVGIRDNFFHLGGHSLRAVVINSRIAGVLGVEMPLRWIFDYPTIETFAQQVRSRPGRGRREIRIERADRTKPLPVSFGQQGMWLLQQLLPDRATYNVPFGYRLTGPFNRDRVQRCLHAIMARHEVLRTALVQPSGILVQQISAAENISLRWSDISLTANSEEQKNSLLQQVLLEEARRPFDLERAPLWRALCVTIADDEHLLAFTFHHAIVDEWSLHFFTAELTRLYNADSRIDLVELPNLPVQYADFSIWQRQCLTGARVEQQRRYWAQQLERLPQPLKLIADRAVPERTARGGVLRFELPVTVAHKLRQLAREERTTLFKLALAAFQVWLHRRTGQTDIVVGTPVSIRRRSELQSLLGFFLNTLPIRVRLNQTDTFREVLTRTRKTVFNALAHADLPFEQMVEIALKGQASRQQPIYQVMFIFLEGPRPHLSFDQLQAEFETIDTLTSKNDLTLNIRAIEDRWSCVLEYASDLFNPAAAGQLGRELGDVIEAVIENPDRPLGHLPAPSCHANSFTEFPTTASHTDDLAKPADVPPEKVYPLAPMQHGMLFQHLFSPDSGIHVEQFVCTLAEPIDAVKLQAAWDRVVSRHSILRTCFRWKGVDTPVQEVRRQIELPFAFIDWRNDLPSRQDEQFAEFLKVDRRRSFALNQAPLFRLTLFQRAEARFELVFTFHHILLDGESLNLVVEEVFTFYDAACRGEEIEIPNPRPYSDFIHWLQTRDLDRAKTFWQNLLAGFSSPIQLQLSPGWHPCEANDEPGDLRTSLSSTITSRLTKIAGSNNLSLNTLVQGAWALVLHRYSGERDIVFGAMRAGRHCMEGSETMTGPVFNTVPVRIRVEPEAFLLSWLQQLREQWVAIREFEHTPLSEVQSWAETRGRPLFDTLLVFDRSTFNSRLRELGGPWQNRHFDVHSRPSYAITASAYGGDELCLQLQFDRNRYDTDAVELMLGHFRVALEGIVANPEARLGELAIMPDVERRRMLVEWNQTSTDYPDAKCVHQLVEQQVERNPDAKAVIGPHGCITYAELNESANRLAHHLRSLNVGPETAVGLCAERSSEMMVALLAILKAGAAYVPLDPGLPEERLHFVLSNAGCAVAITQSSFLPKLETFKTTNAPLQFVVMDNLPLSEPLPNPTCLSDPRHVAYIMYTSGSTGWPKGVEMPHQVLVNLLSWQCATSRMGTGSKTLQFASPGFDVSFQEIFSTWISGGTLVLVPEEVRSDPASLLAAIGQHQIDRVFLPYVMLERLADAAERETALTPHLKEMFVAGEPLRIARHVRRFFEKMPECELWNHYGPTETHVVTAFKMEGPASSWPRQAPIGRPIWNCRIYLLDEQRNPVPVGSPGELFVGGVCVSRGYRGLPDLTRERFLPDPFESAPDGRLYRTGDICRWRPDGQLEYLGRSDNQVKIRGYRVEPGEIERALCEVDGVREAVAIFQENGSTEKRLTAYVVGNSATASESRLKTALRKRLPNYMIPAQIHFVEEVPLTPTGKLNRRALIELSRIHDAPARDRVLPRNLLQLELIRLWQKLFDRPDISPSDNFFELGGYSLLAARLAVEIDKLIGRKLPIGALFQSPTVESLADRLTQENWAPAWSSLVPVQPVGSRPPLFFSHGWGGDVYAALLLAEGFAPDQPIYGLQAVGLDGTAPRHTTVEEMARHYVEEIRSFQPEGPYHLAGYSMGGLIAFEMAQQLYHVGQEVAFIGLLDTSPTFTPWTVYGRALAPFFWQRAGFHLQRWWNMPFRQRGDYVRRCCAHLGWWIKRNLPRPVVITSSSTDSCEVPEVAGYRDYYWAVASAYKIRRYPGTVDLFFSESAHPGFLSFWQYLAREGANLHPVPGTHLQMIQPENLPTLISLLKTALLRAQSATSVRHNGRYANSGAGVG